ncbi:MAG: type II secretion system protein [Planctomycetota bacterium]|jgi:prepilin-type N-terminal cleavage/methylation domain-containing protein
MKWFDANAPASYDNGMKHKLGFTIVELVVVIAIIALLLFIVIPRLTTNHGPHANTSKHLGSIHWRISSYYCKYQKWPDENNWEGHLKEINKEIHPMGLGNYFFFDSWKNPIQYRIIEEDDTQKVLLYSYGKNKTDDNGTGDDIIRKIEPPTQEEINNYNKNR